MKFTVYIPFKMLVLVNRIRYPAIVFIPIAINTIVGDGLAEPVGGCSL
jgi:hypothetical protein